MEMMYQKEKWKEWNTCFYTYSKDLSEGMGKGKKMWKSKNTWKIMSENFSELKSHETSNWKAL